MTSLHLASPSFDPDTVSDAELRRQRAVASLELRADGLDDRFDRITRIAHHVFSVPMASVTVIDGERAIFPGAFGFDDRSTTLDKVLCSVTLSGSLVVVDDLAQSTLHDHLAVAEFGIQFYAGHPLKDPFGNVVGTLAIFDFEARTLDASMLAALEDLAGWAQAELVASAEQTQATRIQASLLPSEPLVVEDWKFAGTCIPSLAVGGDFFDYQMSNGVVRLDLGDVMGKGAGAALVCAGVRSALRGNHGPVVNGVDLGVTTTQVARNLFPDLARSESFVTLFEAAVDIDDGWLRYVDAGSGLCVVVRRDGTVERLHGHDGPIGILEEDHWTEQRTRIGAGDRMLVFSDGLLDLLDGERAWWLEVGELIAAHDRPTALLEAISDLSAARTALDDVTALAVYRFTPDP